MQHRRELLGSAGLGLAIAAAFPKPAIGQGLRELKMVTSWPKDFPGLGTSAERVATSIGTLSKGRLKVTVYGAGQLVGAFECFEAVASGVADMYHAAEYYWENRSPAFSYFSSVPFGFTADELNAWVYFGGGQALWDELSAGYGLKSFLCTNTGTQMGGWFTKEMTSISSFQGLRYRMPGLGGEVLRRFGAIVVNLAAGEIIPALQSGAIDASEWVGPWNDMVLGLHKAANYYYYPGFHEPGTALSLAVNKRLWDSLDSTDKALIESAATAENAYSLAEFNARNAEALTVLMSDPEIRLRKLDDEILRELGRASGEVLAESSRTDASTRRIYDSFRSFRRAILGWGEVSERSYMNARALDFAFGDR
jgi:TRAP-type mannitol/chloroaromatic compound transport system substrate-binding protein